MVSPCLSLSQVTDHTGPCWKDWCLFHPWPQGPEVTDPWSTWDSQKGVVWVLLPEAVAWGGQQGALCGIHSPSPEATLLSEKCPLHPSESCLL